MLAEVMWLAVRIALWIIAYSLVGLAISRPLAYFWNDDFNIAVMCLFWPTLPLVLAFRFLLSVVLLARPAGQLVLRAFDGLMVYHVMARRVQQDEFGTLYRTRMAKPLGDYGEVHRMGTFVEVTDKKNGLTYRLGVPNDCVTAHQAVAWMAHIDMDDPQKYHPIEA